MSSRIPEPPSSFEAEGIPDPGFSSDTQEVTGSEVAGMEPPRDVPLASDDFGTTVREQHEGEPLDGRLEREVPDVLAYAHLDADESEGSDTPFDQRAGQGVGRLVDPDQGGTSDDEADLVAYDAGTDLGGYSAEEAAMHVEPGV